VNTGPLSLIYQIRVSGQLDGRWARWFEGFTIQPAADDQTTLTGPIIDQADLYGVLNRVRDLGLELVSVQRCAPQDTFISQSKQEE